MSSYPKSAQLIIKGHVPGKSGFTRNVCNVLNYFCPTSGGTWLESQFLTAWIAANQTNWLACCDKGYNLDEYHVLDLEFPTRADHVTYPNLPGTYNVTSAMMPSINSAFLYLKSNSRGRSSHGGMHLPGIPRAGVTGNEFTAPYQAILDTLKTSLLTPFTDAGPYTWTLGILSRKASSLIVPPPAVNVVMLQADATLSVWDDNVGTMRRRQEGTVRA